jgi:excisionase family DNA binding protein
MEKVLSVTEAAELAGVSRTAVYYALQDGRLEGLRVGRAWVITEANVLAWQPRDYPRTEKRGHRRR